MHTHLAQVVQEDPPARSSTFYIRARLFRLPDIRCYMEQPVCLHTPGLRNSLPARSVSLRIYSTYYYYLFDLGM